MLGRRFLDFAAATVASLVVGIAAGAPALADCKIRVFADLPLEPNPWRALVKGAVNGLPVVFMVDTGAVTSLMPYPTARRLANRSVAVDELHLTGLGGQVKSGEARFDMKLGQIDLPHESMLVLSMPELDNAAAALIGLDLLAQHDMELDLPDNEIRLMKPEGCTPLQLVYWNKPYSQAPLVPNRSARPAILVKVLLNGHPILAQVDSGASRSVITLEAAWAAGVNPDQDANSKPISIGGIGGRKLAARVAHFQTFTIGDETIRNADLIVSDLWKYNDRWQTDTRLSSPANDVDQPKMLLGADFLRAHRVLIANSLGVMVFSYMGGPVFDASQDRKAAAAQPPAAKSPAQSQ